MIRQMMTSFCLCVLSILFTLHQVECGDVKPQRERYVPDYSVYHNVSQTLVHLQQITHSFSNYVHLDLSYRSRSGNPQPVLRLTNFTSFRNEGPFHNTPASRKRVLFSYGEHAREFLPVESMFFLLRNLTEGLTPDADRYAKQFSSYVLSRVDIFIVAMLNPDGRLLIEQTGNYCWRGTKNGVDLNRNFDWNFGASHGSSRDPNDEEYRGAYAFSEPETEVLLELTKKYHFDAFVSLHSGIRQIYVPFADSASRAHNTRPDNAAAMLDLAEKMARSVKSSKKFTYGIAYTLNDYTADGTVFDFMAGNRKIPFSFAIELWGSGNSANAKCFDLFNPKSSRLQEAVEESFPIYETLLLYIVLYQPELPTPQQFLVSEHTFSATRFMWISLVMLSLLALLQYYINHRMRNPCTVLPCIRKQHKQRRVVSLRSLSSAFSVLSVFKIS